MVSEADREDRTGRRWEIENRRGTNIEAPCGHCGGHGACAWNGADHGGVNCDDPQPKCPHCQGEQPCETCEGSGHKKGSHIFELEQCPRCRGTKVQA